MEKLGIPGTILQEIIYPGNVIGMATDEVKRDCGIRSDLPVVAVHSHDSASAVVGAALETGSDSVYVNCGTWAVIGTVLNSPVINQQTLDENFTNQPISMQETALYKFILGTWLIQQCRRSWEKQGMPLGYPEINAAAAREEPFRFQLKLDDPRFLNPEDMPAAIVTYCKDTEQRVPDNYGQMARGIYESLALSFEDIIGRMEVLLGRKFNTVNIVGGGCQAELLCELIAKVTGKKVISGPVEATAMGNILAQLKALGEIRSWKEGIEIVKRSIDKSNRQSTHAKES